MATKANGETDCIVSDFIHFLNASPTAFHQEAKKRLVKVGYEQLSETEDWRLEAGNKYFFTRNHSTILAFAIGKKYVAGNGFHIVGAHTDSPCLKLKPISKGELKKVVSKHDGENTDQNSTPTSSKHHLLLLQARSIRKQGLAF